MSAVLRPRRRGARGTKLVVLGAASVAALALVGVVFAYLSATVTSGSHGRAVAGTVGAPAGPTVPAYSNNGHVTVTWGAATLGNNQPVLGYYVTRTNASNVTVAACGTAGATLTSSTSCTDGSGSPPANTTVADGTYTYNVTAAYRLWGTAASSAGSVMVDTAPPTSTLTFPGTAGPFKASSWTAGCNVAPFSATNTICGTAADVGSGVSGVGVSIQSTSGPTSGMYWGGSSFNQATETGSALRAASSSDGFLHWTLSFPAANLPDGTFTVRVHAIDAAGNNQAATTAQSFTIDNTAPVTTDNAPAAWQQSTVTVTLSPTDPIVNGSHSGVASTYYTTDGTSPSVAGGVPQGTTQQGASVVLSSEGIFTIKYFSVDNAGNQESVETAANPVRIDKTNPTAGAVLTVGAYIGAGPTTFVKTGQALTDTVANDPTSGGVASGVASVTYYYCSVATDGAGCTPSHSIGSSTTGSSYSVSWDNHLLANGDYRLMATVADNAGNVANTVVRTVTVDNAAPTTSDNSATIGTSWFNVTKTVTLSPTDNAGGSGVATTYYTDGSSTPTTSSTQGTSIALSTDGVYSVKYFSLDNLGNQESVKTASTAIHIDETAPNAGAVLTAGGYVNGGTTYIKTGQTLTDTTTSDPTVNGASSGVGAVAYYYCTSACVGTTPASDPLKWTAVASPATSAPYSVGWDSHLLANGVYSLLVGATDVAGNTAYSGIATVTVDNAKPTTTIATSPIAPDGTNSWFKQASVAFTLAGSDGTGSGVASTSYTIDGGATQVYAGTVTINTQGDHTVSYWSTDNVGNVETTNTTHIKLDNVGPNVSVGTITKTGTAACEFVNGSSVYFSTTSGNGNSCGSPAIGTFVVPVTATDASSGVQKVNYPTGSLANVAGGGDMLGAGPSFSTTYTWGSTSTGSASTITATDNAANAGTTPFNIALDNTAPAGGTISVPRSVTALSVTITTSNYGDGGGSGIASNTITRSTGQALAGGTCPTSGYSGSTTVTSPDTTVVTGLCYLYTLTGTDNVGNKASVASSPVLVDTTDQALPFSNTTPGTYYVLVPAGHAVTITNICGGSGGGGSTATGATGGGGGCIAGTIPTQTAAYVLTVTIAAGGTVNASGGTGGAGFNTGGNAGATANQGGGGGGGSSALQVGSTTLIIAAGGGGGSGSNGSAGNGGSGGTISPGNGSAGTGGGTAGAGGSGNGTAGNGSAGTGASKANGGGGGAGAAHGNGGTGSANNGSSAGGGGAGGDLVTTGAGAFNPTGVAYSAKATTPATSNGAAGSVSLS